jgi:hypothetical protein
MSWWLLQGVVTDFVLRAGRSVLGKSEEAALASVLDAALSDMAVSAMPTADSDTIAHFHSALTECLQGPTTIERPPGEPASVTEALRITLSARLGHLLSPSSPNRYLTPHLTLTLDEFVDGTIDLMAAHVPWIAKNRSPLANALSTEWLLRRERRADDEPAVSIQYLICRSESATRDVLAHRFQDIPIESPRLHETDVSSFWRAMSPSPGGYFTHAQYHSIDEYLAAHPDARRVTDDPDHPSALAIRAATDADLRSGSLSDIPLVRQLLADGVPASEIALFTATDQTCGVDPHRPVSEMVELRAIAPLFLVVTVLNGSVELESLTAAVTKSGTASLAEHETGAVETLRLPAPILTEGISVLIPIGTVLPRLGHRSYSWTQLNSTGDPQTAEVSSLSVQLSNEESDLCGPTYLPTALTCRHGEVNVRALDLRLLYVLSRDWQIGSCPHVIARLRTGKLRYLGTAFGRASHVDQIEQITITPDTEALRIAELEDEITILRSVSVDGVRVRSDIRLAQGEAIEVTVRDHTRVVLEGRYETQAGHDDLAEGWLRRREIVRRYLVAGIDHPAGQRV